MKNFLESFARVPWEPLFPQVNTSIFYIYTFHRSDIMFDLKRHSIENVGEIIPKRRITFSCNVVLARCYFIFASNIAHVFLAEK
jgi:hypothetical protein